MNVSSVSGKLNKYSPAVASRFRNATSVEDVTSIMQDFQEAVDAGHENEAGFPSAAYAASKAGLTAATRVIAGQEEKKGSNVLINSCNPGYVNVGASNIAKSFMLTVQQTDMTRGRGIKTIDDGAQTPVLLAIGDIGDCSGLYWSDERPEDP